MTDLTDELDAGTILRWLTAAAAVVERESDVLTDLDSAIGDADHGTNLNRGFAAVITALGKEAPEAPGAVLVLAGRKLVSSVGGASGPLYGTLLRRTGKALGDEERVTGAQLAAALRTGIDAVAQLGGAARGDKTMLDALYPGVEALTAGGPHPYGAARAASDEGALATVPMRARKGRASYLGERSIGHKDPGAASSALLFNALAQAVTDD